MMSWTAGTPMTVIGAGTMGRGIAIAGLRSGMDVTLVDIDEAVLAAARARIEQYFDHKGEIPRGKLSVSTDLEDSTGGAAAVIEAVPEIEDLKSDIFNRLTAADASTLLVSNTSTMSISRLAEACGSSDRVVGMHFFNPAHKMPLVEVILGERTSDPTRLDALSLARALGKDPIEVRDVPGFVTSRLGLLLGTEAMRLVEEGVASAADVDKAMKLGYRHPMGPLELADLVGLDARLNNLRSMYARSRNELYRAPAILESMVAAGKLGKKSGAGFFEYPENQS